MTLFERVGGATAVERLVARFYDLMDTLPEARGIRALHPSDLQSSRLKLTWFLTGWLGGPPLYTSRYGHPRLRARHLPFAIGTEEARAWMICMEQALQEQGLPPDLYELLASELAGLALHLRNQP
jgi:hemoglobin